MTPTVCGRFETVSIKRLSGCIPCARSRGNFFYHLEFLAAQIGLTGVAHQADDGVQFEVQGSSDEIQHFSDSIYELAGSANIPQSKIRLDYIPVVPEAIFLPQHFGSAVPALQPDRAICPSCLQKLVDSRSVHLEYTFIRCSCCGPGYSLLSGSMHSGSGGGQSPFVPYPSVAQEVIKQLPRSVEHFYPQCSPSICFIRPSEGSSGSQTAPHSTSFGVHGLQAIAQAADLIAGGKIVAIKGLGGFQLACNALVEGVVEHLRLVKKRPHKTFAVMVANLEVAHTIAQVGQAEELLLQSPQSPVVLCAKQEGVGAWADWVGPDVRTVGIMLPYTPLHHLLFQELEKRSSTPWVLIMTSGNRASEPICLDNQEALSVLSGMADGFLLHSRNISMRVDDSVASIQWKDKPLLHRRARGYTPLPLALWPVDEAVSLSSSSEGESSAGIPHSPPPILGIGADLKNTFCLSRGIEGYISQHIGDLGGWEAECFHHDVRESLQVALGVTPELVVHDLHPGYVSTRLARDSGLACLPVQHHVAHAYALLGERQHTSPALVITFDGTGLGDDGLLWGGEVFWVHLEECTQRRIASLTPLPLPGKEVAIREPWRIAYALLQECRLLPKSWAEQEAFFPWLIGKEQSAAHVSELVSKGVRTPLSSGAGRLFDAVSALLGICCDISYEGQAAIRLESAAWQAQEVPVDFACPIIEPACTDGCIQLSSVALFEFLAKQYLAGISVPELAMQYHTIFGRDVARLAARLARQHNVRHVGLSGGCMQNSLFSRIIAKELERQRLVPLLHLNLPPNDGCISYGQAVYGYAWSRKQGRRE